MCRQHSEPIARASDCRLELRERGQGGRELCLRSRNVQLGAAAGVETLLSQIAGTALHVCVTLRHLVTLLQAPELEVVTGDFARHGDEAVIKRGEGAIDRGATRFITAA